MHARSVQSLLTLYGAALAVLTAVALAWAWQVDRSRAAEIDAPRRAAAAAEQSALEAPVAALAAATSAEEADRARTALARARAGLALLASLQEPPPAALEPATAALDRLSDALEARLARPEDPATAAALVEASRSATAALGRLREEADVRAADHENRAVRGLLVVWLGALVLGVGAVAVLRWRVEAIDRQVDRLVRRHLPRLADALERAANGEAMPELPADPAVAPLARAVERAGARLDDLRAMNARIRRSSTFTRELVDALSLAEREADVWATARRAAAEAFPRARCQALVVDDEGIVPVFDDAAPACELDDPERCPAIRRGRPVHHLPDRALGRCPLLRSPDEATSCAPVAINGVRAAVIQVSGHGAGAPHGEALDTLALAVGARLGVVRSLAAREHEAATDALTGLANRRALDARLDRLDRAGTPYAVVVADLDHFKLLNDTHGHAAGDACLQLFAQVLRDACRDTDLPARVGGEEFVVLLPGAPLQAGLAVAGRIRTMLAEAVRRHPTPFTVSIGVAARPEHGESADAVLRAGDAALYDAKAAGRDRVARARRSAHLELVGDAVVDVRSGDGAGAVAD